MSQRPARVEKARLEGDTIYLSNAGKKGAKVVAQNRHAAQLMTERVHEQRQLSEHHRAQEANEDIIPLDTYD